MEEPQIRPVQSRAAPAHNQQPQTTTSVFAQVLPISYYNTKPIKCQLAFPKISLKKYGARAKPAAYMDRVRGQKVPSFADRFSADPARREAARALAWADCHNSARGFWRRCQPAELGPALFVNSINSQFNLFLL